MLLCWCSVGGHHGEQAPDTSTPSVVTPVSSGLLPSAEVAIVWDRC
jgi:hypothetical protein